MSDQDREDLLARRLLGEDVSAGDLRVGTEPIVPVGHQDGEVKIGKSLRVPMAMFERITAVAQQRRMSWSALVREWIGEGLDRAEAADRRDPVIELRRTIDAAARALRELEQQREAA